MIRLLRTRPWQVAAAGCTIAALSTAAALVTCAPRRPTVSEAPSETRSTPAAIDAIAIPQHRPIHPSERAGYAGSRACIPCHRRYAEQLDSHHARTLARMDVRTHSALFRRREVLKDPVHSANYRPRLIDGRAYVEVASGNRTLRGAPEYVFGSGNRTFVYVGRHEKKLTEFRISYYRQADRWYWTATQEVNSSLPGPLGRVRDPADFEQCFNCHTTALVKDGGLQLDRSLLGIGCETCHGPGRPHIDAARRRDPDLKMIRLSRVRDRISLELCGQCHRAPRTGDPDDPVLRRALPRLQGLALSLSKCFVRSNGKLSCLTCHDPHRNADTITRAGYNGKCLSCHGSRGHGQVACPVQPRGDCVSCHMPQQPVTIPTNPTFSNHWIKVWSREVGAPD